MTWVETAQIESEITTFGRIKPLFIQFLSLSQPQTLTAFSVYAATLPEFYEGLEDHYKNGTQLLGVFDYSESHNKVAVEQMGKLYQLVGQSHPAKPTDPFRVGTTSQSHQILHMKTIILNCPLPGQAWPASRMYQSWQDAARDRYPVVWSGSWNLTPGADLQSNNVDIIASPFRAQKFLAAIQQTWQWIDSSEKQFNLEELAALPAV